MPQNSVESTSARRVFLTAIIFIFGFGLPAGMCQTIDLAKQIFKSVTMPLPSPERPTLE